MRQKILRRRQLRYSSHEELEDALDRCRERYVYILDRKSSEWPKRERVWRLGYGDDNAIWWDDNSVCSRWLDRGDDIIAIRKRWHLARELFQLAKDGRLVWLGWNQEGQSVWRLPEDWRAHKPEEYWLLSNAMRELVDQIDDMIEIEDALIPA